MTEASDEWGEWSLGDLADVGREIASLLGPSEDVEMLVIEKPSEYHPHVRITVRDASGVFRLRNALKTCGYEAQFAGYPSSREWTVEVAEMVVTIEQDRGAS